MGTDTALNKAPWRDILFSLIKFISMIYCPLMIADTFQPGEPTPACDCRLCYTGEEDQLLPVSVIGKHDFATRKTYNLVSYRMLFDFFALEMTDGVSESGYIRAFNRKRRMLCGTSLKECPKTIFIKAVEDFEHALEVDEVEAFTCEKCPSEESSGDGKDEVHIGDGVSEGTQLDLVPDHIKSYRESAPDTIVGEGLDVHERTIVVQPKIRKVLYSMLEGNRKSTTTALPVKPSKLPVEIVKVANKKMKTLLVEEIDREKKIFEFLEYVTMVSEDMVPECYITLIYEITKNTPISGIFQTNSRTSVAALKSFLDESLDVFSDKELLDHLNDEVPVIMRILAKIKEFENCTFLPEPVKNLFESMLELLSKMQKLAAERFVKSGVFDAKEPPNEYFPSLPIHSEKKNFKADNDKNNKSEKVDDEDCNKDYPKAPKMTPGLAHIFCQHKVCKGFVTMTSAENPEIFTKILTRRLPKTVKAERRVFLYDNSCNLHKNALKRDAKEISKFKIFTDRHHWKNHTGCSESYNSDRYNYLKNVNTQICEQKNRSLRKLSSTLAYCSFKNYQNKVKLFFIMNNYEEKGNL